MYCNSLIDRQGMWQDLERLRQAAFLNMQLPCYKGLENWLRFNRFIYQVERFQEELLREMAIEMTMPVERRK